MEHTPASRRPIAIASSRHFAGRDRVDQPPVSRLFARDQLAGQEQLPRTAVADLTEQVVHDDRRNQSPPDLGIADTRRLDRDRQVARRHQARAPGQGVAVDCGDRRLGQGVQLLDQVGERLQDGDRLDSRPRAWRPGPPPP